MITDIGDPPEEIIDAIRALTTTGAAIDTEIESLVVLDWLMLGFDQKARERVLNWAWDRYVEQPKRDALKLQTQARAQANLSIVCAREEHGDCTLPGCECPCHAG